MLVLLGILFWKLPSFVYCSFVVQPGTSSIAYAPQDGIFELEAEPGDRVTVGQTIGRVTNDHTSEQLRKSKQEILNLKQRLKLAERLLSESSQVAIDIGNLTNQIRKQNSVVEMFEQQQSDLTLKSNRNGILAAIPVAAREVVNNTNVAWHSNLLLSLIHISEPTRPY